MREREKIFCTYSGPWECVKSFDCILIQLPTFPFPMEKSRNSSVIATRLPPGELEKYCPLKNLKKFKSVITCDLTIGGADTDIHK